MTPAVKSNWWIAAALGAITLLAYANSFAMGFAFDTPIILNDPRIQKATVENLKLILNHEYWWPVSFTALYRPVTTASYLLNYAIFGNGQNSAGYHCLNFALHAGNVWLVYLLARRLLKRIWPAFFAAALWAAHPIGTESVTNVVGRADELAAMAVLGGLLLYIRSTRMRGARLGLAAAALFAIATLGVFSKENAAVLLGLMLLWDMAFGIGNLRPGVWRRLPAYGAVAAALTLVWLVRRTVFWSLPLVDPPFGDNPLVAADFWTARFTAIKVIGLDLWLLVCPLRLSSDHPYNQIPLAGWGDGSAWLALAVVAAVIAIAVARRRQDPLIFFLAGFFGIALLPVSNLLFQIGSIMAERFLYLPSVAFAVAVSAVAYRLERGRRTAVVLAVVVTLFAVRAFVRNFAWKDNFALTSADVRSAPGGFRVHNNLAKELFERDPVHNLDAAIRQEEMSWNIVASLPPEQVPTVAPYNLAAFYRYKGDVSGGPTTAVGRTWYQKSLAVALRGRETDRAVEAAHDAIAAAAAAVGGRAVTARFGSPAVYLSLGQTFARLDRNAEALEAYRYARNMDPNSPEFYDDAAQVYLAGGNPSWAAITTLEKALVDDNLPATMSALRDAYARLPKKSCAVVQEGGVWKVNMDCPGVPQDVCTAFADLVPAFVEARNLSSARRFKRHAIELYRCPAASFESALPDGGVF